MKNRTPVLLILAAFFMSPLAAYSQTCIPGPDIESGEYKKAVETLTAEIATHPAAWEA